MALTTFVSGQVLTAAQLNDSFAAVGGLRLVKTQTIGTTVSSVTVTNAFSSSYDNYLIRVTGGVGSTTQEIRMTLGATATGYYYGGAYTDYTGAGSGVFRGGNVAFWRVGSSSSLSISVEMIIKAPYLADETIYTSQLPDALTAGSALWANGYLSNTTSYTDFTLTPSTGTLTGGTIAVYGYANTN
jgi:hypothetical protein